MGQNATGRSKPTILRIRVEEELNKRVLDLMTRYKWTGTKDQFTAFLVEKGLELTEYEQQILKGSVERLIAEKPAGYDPKRHGAPLTGRSKRETEEKKGKSG